MRLKIPNRADQFMKDYRLPLWSTVGLLLVLVLMMLLRTYERSIIAGVLGDNSSSKSDYARLLSKDKDAELKKNDIDSEKSPATPSTNASANTSTTLTIKSDGGNTNNGTGGGTIPPGGDGGVEEPEAGPFSAKVAGFGLRAQSEPFVCSNSGPSGSLSQMCKKYDFVAAVTTSNGPGTVNHKLSWRGIEANEQTQSFQAPSGDAFTQVNYSVKLRCDSPSPYVFKFTITQPQISESQEISLDHYCGTATP